MVLVVVQDVVQWLHQKGEREVIYTNCQAQHHPSIEEVCHEVIIIILCV